MNLTEKEKEILRTLAREYMSFATLPVQTEKMNLWKALNRGEMERPMVAMSQYPWNEMNSEGELTLQVADPFWRGVEDTLRKDIYLWKHCPADMVLEPFVTIPLSVTNSMYGISADTDECHLSSGDTAPGQHYNRIIRTMEDVSLIKDMEIAHDEALSEKHREEGEILFRGIAPIVQSHGISFHLGVWDKLSTYIGMQDVYFELLDHPDLLHACMDRLTEATIAGIKQANELQIHDDIAKACHCSYIYEDERLPRFGEGKGSVAGNSWAFGMAQLFTSVSPDTTEEFETPYIKRMAEHFHSIYYGCCEREDDRLDRVKMIPNVRKISCSPWSDRRNFAEKIGPDLVMSNKPSPALVATSALDEGEIERDLRETMEAAKANNVNLEFILKDISTVNNDPSRLSRWNEIAMKVVQDW